MKPTDLTPEYTEEVRARNGETFAVDTSNETCQQFGFKHGDNILVPFLSRKGVVIGVAPLSNDSACASGDVLWVRLEGEDSVCFFPDPKSDLVLAN